MHPPRRRRPERDSGCHLPVSVVARLAIISWPVLLALVPFYPRTSRIMFPTVRFLSLLLLLLLPIVGAACSSDATGGSDEGQLQLRIRNEMPHSATIGVVALVGSPASVDFGSVGPGTTTGYRPVSSSFRILVDGEPYLGDPSLTFGVANPPSTRWTITLGSDRWEQEADR